MLIGDHTLRTTSSGEENWRKRDCKNESRGRGNKSLDKRYSQDITSLLEDSNLVEIWAAVPGTSLVILQIKTVNAFFLYKSPKRVIKLEIKSTNCHFLINDAAWTIWVMSKQSDFKAKRLGKSSPIYSLFSLLLSFSSPPCPLPSTCIKYSIYIYKDNAWCREMRSK